MARGVNTGEAETPTQSGDAPQAATALPRRSRSRVLEWFWRGSALAELEAELAKDPRAIEYERRARAAADLAARTLSPDGRGDGDASDATVCDLYRQAAYWALLRLEMVAHAPDAAAEAKAADLPPVSAVFARADPTLLATVAGSPEAALEMQRELGTDSFLSFVALSAETRGRLARRARDFVGELVLVMAQQERARDALLFGRLVRIGLLVMMLGAVVLVILRAGEFVERRRDLAQGKSWRASSSMSVGCQSPAQVCSESLNFFFHTTDEDKPWVQIDLGRPERFSRVRVVNRKDCCADRAVPLLLEVSKNGSDWKEVARQPATFTNWLATFAPVDARWVRLRADRRTMLHLAQVRVLP